MENKGIQKHPYRSMVPKGIYKSSIPGMTHKEIMERISAKRGYHKRSDICKRCGKKVEKGEPRHRTRNSLYHLKCYEETQIGNG
jgi:hypothetical protein